jgi:addiction module HigA family antidote
MTIQREELHNMKWGNTVTGEALAPVHPGEILLHDFIEPMGLTRYKVAKSTSVPQRRIDEICQPRRHC